MAKGYQPSKDYPQTGGQARIWVAYHARLADPPDCHHGHLGCSTWEGGPCLEEDVLHRFSELEEV